MSHRARDDSGYAVVDGGEVRQGRELTDDDSVTMLLLHQLRPTTEAVGLASMIDSEHVTLDGPTPTGDRIAT